jgi:hypothetical protein
MNCPICLNTRQVHYEDETETCPVCEDTVAHQEEERDIDVQDSTLNAS